MNYIPLLLCVAVLTGCGDDSANPIQPDSYNEVVRNFKSETVNEVSFEAVSETFMLGSNHTDLQREIMRKKLVGSVVKWNLPVYEISLTDGIYKVNTKTNILNGSKKPILPAVVYITPKNDAERLALEALKTNDVIAFKGRVADILFRTAVIINPAVLEKYRD